MSVATLRAERRITEFRPEDAAAVAALFNGSSEGWPDGFEDAVPFTAERVLLLQQEVRPRATFISWEGAEAAGYCSFFDYAAEHDAGYVGLLNAAIKFHGRGHGRDLLKAALQRCLDLGYHRLDLHTWQGNMKAVPLYKKTGFFWVPDTAVHMENYLPMLLRIPALADFWAEADWYQAQVRDLTVQEDLFLDGKMRVYPYEFRHGGRFVKATIDATARGLTALETEHWRVSCRLDDRILIQGLPAPVRWEVENRTGRPLSLTLLAHGERGLYLAKQETVLVPDIFTTEALLDVEADYQPPEPGQPEPRVTSVLLIDGLPIHLTTGVRVRPPIEVRLSPRRTGLVPSVPTTVTVEIKNHLTAAARASLTMTPSPDLTWSEREDQRAGPMTLVLPAESYAGLTFRAETRTSGLHQVEVRGEVETGGATIPLTPVTLLLPATWPGQVISYGTAAPHGDHAERDTRTRELRVEAGVYRLVVALRQGNFHLENAATGDQLVGGNVMVGPPFNWQIRARVVYAASVERNEGTAIVRLRGSMPHVPAAIVEHELRLWPNGLLSVQTTLANAGGAPLEAQVRTAAWGGGDEYALPAREGLIVTTQPEFPDWADPALQRPERLQEPWVARQGNGKVAGVFWSAASRVEVGQWNLARLDQGEAPLAPWERHVLSPVYLYGGPGDWQTVRALWRTYLAPQALERPPATRDVLVLRGAAVPQALLVGEASPILDSVTNRELSGTLRWQTPEGWQILPTTLDLTELRLGQPRTFTTTVQHREQRPGAAALSASLRTDRSEQRVFDGAVLDLGRADRPVTVEEGTRDGHMVLTVDNGFMRFTLCPAFIGSVMALETADGVNHVHSAFPAPREFGWLRPWYGGLFAVVYEPGLGELPDAARLYEEHFDAEVVEETGQDERVWRGVVVRAILRGDGLHGLRLRAAYLTLPGSNVLAMRCSVANDTTATLRVAAAQLAFLQPDGNIAQSELLLDPDGKRRLLRARRTIDVAAGPWVGVRNGQTGLTLALVAAARTIDAHVTGIDWGGLGAHAATQAVLPLAPHSEQSVLSFLVLARDEKESAAYRALASAEALP